MADLIVAATTEDAPGVTPGAVLAWAAGLDPAARLLETPARVPTVVFQHPEVGRDRAMHATFEVRLLQDGSAVAIDGAWPEYLDVALFLRGTLPEDVPIAMFDEAGNHVLEVPPGLSRAELASRWAEIAG